MPPIVAAKMVKQADVQIKSKDAEAPEQSKKAMSLFIFFFQSVVLAVLFHIVLRCSGRDVQIAVCRLSLLFCSYFYSAICALSSATRNRKARFFVCLTYVAFLALVVDAGISHVAGTIIMYLNSLWIAGMFGHVIAEHRASENAEATSQEAWEELGRELVSVILLTLVYSASAIPMCMLAADCSFEYVSIVTMVILFLGPIAMHFVLGKQRASEKAAPSSIEAQGKLAGESGLIMFLALMFSACGLFPMCIIMVIPRGALLLSPPLGVLVEILPIVLFSCVPAAIICTLKPLPRGGGGIVLILGVECDTQKVLAFLYASSFVLFTFNFRLVSEVGAVVVLGLAVFFGYCNGIHPCFLGRSKPKMEQLPADEVQKNQSDGGNKEQTEITSDSTTTTGKQTDNQVLGNYP